MLNYIRIFVAFALLLTTAVVRADGEKSFSKQMNEIKRSGEYVYAEASAADESDAKSACDELLKIEITKYLVSANAQSQSDRRIVKNIADYDCRYIVQTRGDMIRVFGFVAKKNISMTENDNQTTGSSSADKKDNESRDSGETGSQEKIGDGEKSLPVSTDDTTQAEGAASDMPVEKVISRQTVNNLNTEGLHLAKWQIDMLENIIRESDMMQAKKLLNRYKYQNRIKRLGDKSIPNPRPADSFYLIYDNTNKPVALLAPSPTVMHYDMLSGTTVSLDNYSVSQYYWFQISQ